MPETTEVSIELPARGSAVAWLNAFLASGQDEARPTLHRTLALEFFDAGVQFVAMDGGFLLRTWVPADDGAPWPDLAEVPERTLVVFDVEGFGVGFMRSLLKATQEDAVGERLNISTIPADEGATLSLGAEFIGERLTLRACGMRIDLKLFESPYPNWRIAAVEPAKRLPTEQLNLDPKYLRLVGKLKHVQKVEWNLFGEDKGIMLRGIGEGEPRALGILMPLRAEA